MTTVPTADPRWQMPAGAGHCRYPTLGHEAMVATSQPLATHAGLTMLEKGGNACDAAIAAAAVLCVLEPMWTGIGGDCFAIVWDGSAAIGLDAAGPAPANAAPLDPVAERGARSITVPGAVAGWAALSQRFGRLGLDTCLRPAIDVAERGFPVSPIAAWHWRNNEAPPEFGDPPAAGQMFRIPELSRTLRAIAEAGPQAFYCGPTAEAITSASWLGEKDLASYAPRWVVPLWLNYKGLQVLELPPPTQGISALEGLGLLQLVAPDLHGRITSVRLALQDARAHVRDGADVSGLLDLRYLHRRRSETAGATSEPSGGTVQICVVDGDRTAISLIQSLAMPFGSRVVAPGTGVLLHNRGAYFSLHGRVEPSRRPFHTLIPAMLLRDGALYGLFGIVGGPVQAQAHVQFVSNLVDNGLDPQAALDSPRFAISGNDVLLEQGLWKEQETLKRLGHRAKCHDDRFSFGGGQAIIVDRDRLIGGSDSRKDGIAVGI